MYFYIFTLVPTIPFGIIGLLLTLCCIELEKVNVVCMKQKELHRDNVMKRIKALKESGLTYIMASPLTQSLYLRACDILIA